MVTVPDQINVYCIVVTYNGLKWVDKCFGSLRDSSLSLRTVVVDNGSFDGTQEAIKSKFPEVEIVQAPRNLGFGAGNNVGIKKAMQNGADFLFLLNQDAWIEPDTILTLVNMAQWNPGFGILSPMHLQSDNENLDPQFAGYISPPKCNFFKDVYRNKVTMVYPCQFINAAAWLMTKNCITTVGLFEPLFFIYGEDYNYVQRLKYHKLSLGLVPTAKIVHDRGDREGKKNKKGTELEVSTFLYVKLLNVQENLLNNFVQSFKVFVKHGVNFRTMKNFIKVICKFYTLTVRVNKYKDKSYLLD